MSSSSYINSETLLLYGQKKDITESLQQTQNKRSSSPNKNAQLNTKDTLNAMFNPKQWEEDGKLFIQEVSPEPATRERAKELFEALEIKLQECRARDKGICPIREQIFSQCFDEIIRQVTIDSPERGLLLLRVRDEIKMTIASYQTLYESAILFGIRKQLQAENEKNELRSKNDQLKRKKIELNNKKKQLIIQLEGLKRQLNERKEIETARREHEKAFVNDELAHLQTLLDSIGKK